MGGVLRYEWLRLVTIRSTWILSALALVVSAGVSFLLVFFASDVFPGSSVPFGAAAPNTDGPPIGVLNTSVVVFAAVFLGVVAAQAIGQEYRHGLIRLTLTQFPQRNRVIAAKLIMVTAFLVVFAIATLVAIYLGAQVGAMLNDKSVTFNAGTDVPLSIRAVLYVVLFGLFGFAISAITRNLPIGVIVPIVMALLAEPIIVLIAGLASWDWVADVLPFTNGGDAIFVEGEVWRHIAVFAAWALGLTAIGWVLFDRRDA